MTTTTQPTDRQRLLERWSRLEPERCRPRYGEYQIYRNGWRWVYQSRDRLLGALIEAITARGWGIELDIKPHETLAFLYNTKTGAGLADVVTAATPADALLAAYIAAAG